MKRVCYFDYDDDKQIKYQYDLNSIKCNECGYEDMTPTQARVFFGVNVAVDFECSKCKSKVGIIPHSEHWVFVSKG